MKKKAWMAGLAILCLSETALAQDIWRTDSLQEVVVTGTGTLHLLKNAPVQTEVISRKMLENYGGSSLEDILAGLTSSFAFNEGDMGSQMQMNGLGNSYILILIDGKRIHGDVGGENNLGLIDPHNIEKIEIVKGASSALYGSDAIAGVINIITKKHDSGLLVENATRVGSYGDVRQHNGLGFSIGKLKSYTNFHLQHSDGWQNTATEDEHQTEFLITDSRNKTVNRYQNWQLSERLTYTPVLRGAWSKEQGASLELYAEGSTYGKHIYRPCGKYAAVDVKTYDFKYRNQSAAIGGVWKFDSDNHISLDVNWDRHAYYYDYTAITLTDGYDPQGNFTPYYPYFPGDEELQSDQRRWMANLKGVFALPYDNRLSTGLEYRYDLLKAPMRVVDGRATDHTEALYVQDEWTHQMFRGFATTNITAGLRLNHNGQFGYRLTPKVSGMLALGNNWRIRATWSQGFKTPTPKEQHYRYVRYMSGTYLYLGNTDLTPQTSNYYSLSGEWNWRGLNVTLTGYLNDVDNMITLVTIPNSQAPDYYIAMYDPTKTRQYQNLETATTRGIDFSLRYRISREWMAGASYSYLDTDAQQYDTNHDRLKDVVIDGMAHHKGSWFATWNHTFYSRREERGEKSENRLADNSESNLAPRSSLPAPRKSLGFGLYGRMSSKRYYQINGDGKGYQIWRLTGNYSFSTRSEHNPMTFKIEAGVDNIFDYIDRTPHGLHLGTTSPGRTVYATLTVNFNHGKKLKFSNNNKFNSNYKNNNEED